MRSAHKKAVLGKVIVYVILIALIMIIPFLWMLSASIKSDREVFQMNPFVFIPENPRWSNYVDIWTKIPFAKLHFRHKNGLFPAYIATMLCPGRYTWCLSSS